MEIKDYQKLYFTSELNRWIAHQELLETNRYKDLKRVLPISNWWKEVGTFVSIPGRQIGKTTLINKLYENLVWADERSLVIVPTNRARDRYMYKRVFTPQGLDLKDINIEKTNLFLDEFTYLPRDFVKSLYNLQWKSISIFGTLR